MIDFVRIPAERWHREVPGARWFQGDLHVHTLDDHPGNRISWTGRSSAPIDRVLIDQYARELLRTAIARGVEVIGLTPHAVYCGGNEALSAVWRTVEIWAADADDDGVPFREKIYAVFPGFEPSMADGARGVHLQFLFDPEIGREGLVRAFHTVMDGVDPWRAGSLVNAGRSAADAFAAMASRSREDGTWDWLCLAPHAFASQQGLFGQLKSQMLKQFRHQFIAGLELGDSQLPDAHVGRDWLAVGMGRYHHAFLHASDAYRLNPDPTSTALDELGSRTTMFKLAEPRIEALRQAFLGADSRIRLTMVRDPAGGEGLAKGVELEALPLGRPWLRAVTVRGGTSFFGGHDGGAAIATTIRLNPDLTCIIGGRMSGKSTLLDGLRVAFGFPLPIDDQVAEDVRGRGRDRFLSGSPEVDVDVCGPTDPTADIRTQWPAVFFTQRELQQAVADQEGLRDLLFQLVPGRAPELRSQFATIGELTSQIRSTVPQLARALSDLGEAEQALAGADAARAGLERHERVGAARLSAAQADVGRIRSVSSRAADAEQSLAAAVGDLDALVVPAVTTERIGATLDATRQVELLGHADAARNTHRQTVASVAAYRTIADEVAVAAQSQASNLRAELERALIAEGGTAEELNQFVALSAVAQDHEERRIRAESTRTRLGTVRARLTELNRTQSAARTTHREAMSEVIASIAARFDDRIRVLVDANGVQDELETWILSLRERGVTRWWNDREYTISPVDLLDAADAGNLGTVGMSDQVAATFTAVLSEPRRWEVHGVSTPDRYVLQLLVGPGDYRDMARLSGGSQVSLLLSLLLESDDSRPLVIDQPEEELDKAYLFDVVLPALRRLKGVRQIVFVTHDANIVVNGDADQVVFLKADADRGWVQAEGAIEQAPIREAILTVLDGGEAAFELRSRKYGF